MLTPFMSKRARKQLAQLTRHHGGGGADSITGFMGNKHRRLMPPEDVTVIRPGIITAVTEVDGPPSAHIYDGDFTDIDGGIWEDLSCIGRPANVIQLPMEVDDHIGVLISWDGSDWVNRGILGHEGVEFIICECDWS